MGNLKRVASDKYYELFKKLQLKKNQAVKPDFFVLKEKIEEAECVKS